MGLVKILIIAFITLGAVNFLQFKNETQLTLNPANFLQEKLQERRDDLLLPDLRITPPEDLFIDVQAGTRRIRFDTVSFNSGRGTLELIGETNAERQSTSATQVVKKTDGTEERREIGEFVFHPGHDHWHIENYTQFQLWTHDNEGKPSSLIATTDKMSFCVWDEKIYDPTVPGVPLNRKYPECSSKNEGKEIQGNSVGWGDIYGSNFEGQELDISGVPDGKYLIRSVINVDKKILESDYSNNEAIVYIELKGNSLRVMDSF